MKKYLGILLLFGFTIISYQSKAQDFKGGLLLAGAFTQIGGDEMSGFDKLGLLGGVHIAYPIRENIDITMAMTFIQKGSRKVFSEEDLNPPGIWNRMQLSYIEVPLGLATTIKDRYYLEGQFAVAYLLGASGSDASGTYEADFRNTDFSLYAKAGYLFDPNWMVFGQFGSSVYTVSKSKTNPVWSVSNTGFINIVAAFGLQMTF